MVLDAMIADCRNKELCQHWRMRRAKKNIDFYNGEFDLYWNRELEQEHKPYRTSMFMKCVIDGISNLYKFTPNRVVENSADATKWYQKVMKVNHMAAKMLKAEKLAAISDFAAFCISGTDDVENPIKITLWSADSLCLHFDPNDATQVVGVIACDKVNGKDRKTLWTAERVQVYLCGDEKEAQFLLVKDEVNPYGVLPWVFVSHNSQVLDFFAGSPGTHLRKANDYINSRLTKMGQACKFQMEPLGVASNVEPTFKLGKVRPGDFVNLPANASDVGGDKDARFEYVAAPSFVNDAWTDLVNYVDHTMQSNGIPGSATEMLGGVARTGISIVMEQWPLVSASRAKQPQWKEYEHNLAKVIFTVANNWLIFNGVEDYPMLGEIATNLDLSVTYNETFVAEAPGAERDRSNEFEVTFGLKSKFQVYQERTGASREQAVAHFMQVLEDNFELAELEKQYGAQSDDASGDGIGTGGEGGSGDSGDILAIEEGQEEDVEDVGD